jgi:serine/threonine protein kinase
MSDRDRTKRRRMCVRSALGAITLPRVPAEHRPRQVTIPHSSDGSFRDGNVARVAVDSLVGTALGRFRVEARLGEGGLGVVYRAFDVKLNRAVALKVLTENPGDVSRVLVEARAAAALGHANIVAVHDVLEVDGLAFIVMELVEGRSLRAELTDGAIAPRRR